MRSIRGIACSWAVTAPGRNLRRPQSAPGRLACPASGSTPGRVNSRRRLRRLAGHVDSVDGTYLAFGPDRNIVRLVRWLDELATQPTLL